MLWYRIHFNRFAYVLSIVCDLQNDRFYPSLLPPRNRNSVDHFRNVLLCHLCFLCTYIRRSTNRNTKYNNPGLGRGQTDEMYFNCKKRVVMVLPSKNYGYTFIYASATIRYIRTSVYMEYIQNYVFVISLQYAT